MAAFGFLTSMAGVQLTALSRELPVVIGYLAMSFCDILGLFDFAKQAPSCTYHDSGTPS